MTTPHLGVELSRLGYPRYANELRELHQTLNAFCNPQVPGAEVPRCMSCTLEIELSYLRLRTTRPRVVWEISPLHGFTTMMILTALHLNNNSARLHSFDRHGGALVHVTASKYPHLFPLWTFHMGDVAQRIELAAAKSAGNAHSAGDVESGALGRGDAFFTHVGAPRPEYLFLDSYHSAQMGTLYVDHLLPAVQSVHTYVSLHDVYNPLFWTDGVPSARLT